MKSTTFLTEDRFEYCNCPICGNDNSLYLLDKDRYKMGIITVQCRGCSMIYTNPQLSPASLTFFYKEVYREYYQSLSSPSLTYISQYKKDLRSNLIINHIATFTDISELNIVLDIGSAEGAFLKAIKDRNQHIELLAVEPNSNFADFCHSLTGATIYSSIESIQRNDIDLIVLNHVLEHIKAPVEYLNKLRNLLSPKGRICIVVPNAKKYRSIKDIHIAHIHHFTRTTLKYALCKANLSGDNIQAISPPLHPKSLIAVSAPTNESSKRVSLRHPSLTELVTTKLQFLLIMIHAKIFFTLKFIKKKFTQPHA